MKIAIVNMTHIGSTGKIMFACAECARKAENDVRTYSPVYYMRREKMPQPEITGHVYFGIERENMLHYAIARMFGLENYGSYFGTLQLIHALKAYQPDIVHLHNLHNYTINLPLLFHYLKESGVRVVWTLHDCWTMTGRCPHFVMAKCDKWKDGCSHCPQIREYPRYYIDQTNRIWHMKQQLFTSMPHMTIVTPSKWLADLVGQSYLKDYPVRVINNGIDLDVFRPAESDFRIRYNIPSDKPVILGVAFDWGERKGLDVFIKLAEDFGDKYQIVLVGTNDHIDAQLPENIISVHRTQNQQELAEIYSAADIFVNATREDTFPTVNIEALACGTPVITFETGGSPECIDDTCGIVVPCDDVGAMENAICHIIEERPFSQEACRKRAEMFDMNDKFAEYVKLYQELFEENQ